VAISDMQGHWGQRLGKREARNSGYSVRTPLSARLPPGEIRALASSARCYRGRKAPESAGRGHMEWALHARTQAVGHRRRRVPFAAGRGTHHREGELADRHPLISARRTTLLGIVSGQACSLEARPLQRLKGLRVEFTGLMGGRRAAIGLTLQFDGKSE
jgi:hypothetical protein